MSDELVRLLAGGVQIRRSGDRYYLRHGPLIVEHIREEDVWTITNERAQQILDES